MSGQVFILGSGFSRAINERMPTLDDLSALVVDRLGAVGRTPIPGQGTPLERDFERWLTFLADAPPWLDDGDAFRNRAAFADVSMAVHEALSRIQCDVVGEPPPGWLHRLIRHWQDASATVITFNYDVLVELSWITWLANPWSHLYPVTTTPAASRFGTVLGGSTPTTGMKLLKLHGSLNWYYSGIGSPPGDVIYDVGVEGPWGSGGAGPCYDLALVADRAPCIVPPASLKNPYYGNRTLHTLWERAAQALDAAEELVVMGFSLPASDQLVSAMLASRVRDACVITPVDRSPAVAGRLRGLLDDPHQSRNRVRDDFVERPDAIQHWVEVNVPELPPTSR